MPGDAPEEGEAEPGGAPVAMSANAAAAERSPPAPRGFRGEYESPAGPDAPSAPGTGPLCTSNRGLQWQAPALGAYAGMGPRWMWLQARKRLLEPANLPTAKSLASKQLRHDRNELCEGVM